MSETRKELVQNPSRAFSRFHRRELPSDLRMTDIDLCYPNRQNEVRVLGEVITIRNGDLRAAPEKYPVWTHKREVLEDLSDRLDVPAFVVWCTPRCDEFVVRNLESDETVRVNADEYASLVRLLRGDDA